MPEKLLTLKELSAYLDVSEDVIVKLVESGVVPAYRICGSFLRFRREQIDAIKHEISVMGVKKIATLAGATERVKFGQEPENDDTLGDKVCDFFYFNDFYLICSCIIACLLYVIFTM